MPQGFQMTMDLWLDHCLQSGDSAIASSLVTKTEDVIVQKGHRASGEAFIEWISQVTWRCSAPSWTTPSG